MSPVSPYGAGPQCPCPPVWQVPSVPSVTVWGWSAPSPCGAGLPHPLQSGFLPCHRPPPWGHVGDRVAGQVAGGVGAVYSRSRWVGAGRRIRPGTRPGVTVTRAADGVRSLVPGRWWWWGVFHVPGVPRDVPCPWGDGPQGWGLLSPGGCPLSPGWPLVPKNVPFLQDIVPRDGVSCPQGGPLSPGMSLLPGEMVRRDGVSCPQRGDPCPQGGHLSPGMSLFSRTWSPGNGVCCPLGMSLRMSLVPGGAPCPLGCPMSPGRWSLVAGVFCPFVPKGVPCPFPWVLTAPGVPCPLNPQWCLMGGCPSSPVPKEHPCGVPCPQQHPSSPSHNWSLGGGCPLSPVPWDVPRRMSLVPHPRGMPWVGGVCPLGRCPLFPGGCPEGGRPLSLGMSPGGGSSLVPTGKRGGARSLRYF